MRLDSRSIFFRWNQNSCLSVLHSVNKRFPCWKWQSCQFLHVYWIFLFWNAFARIIFQIEMVKMWIWNSEHTKQWHNNIVKSFASNVCKCEEQLFENELRCNFNLVFVLPFKVKSNHFALFERLCNAFGKVSMLANHHAILLFIMKFACDHGYKTYQKRKLCPFSNRLRKNKQTPGNCAECNWFGKIESIVWCVPSNLILTFRVRIESFPCQLPDVHIWNGLHYPHRNQINSMLFVH